MPKGYRRESNRSRRICTCARYRLAVSLPKHLDEKSTCHPRSLISRLALVTVFFYDAQLHRFATTSDTATATLGLLLPFVTKVERVAAWKMDCMEVSSEILLMTPYNTLADAAKDS